MLVSVFFVVDGLFFVWVSVVCLFCLFCSVLLYCVCVFWIVVCVVLVSGLLIVMLGGLGWYCLVRFLISEVVDVILVLVGFDGFVLGVICIVIGGGGGVVVCCFDGLFDC